MVDANGFEKSGTALIRYEGEEKEVVIPEGITDIWNMAFAECRKIKKVVIPRSVTKIGRSAFENCKALAVVQIDAETVSIAENAFKGCIKLKELRGSGVIGIENILGLTKKKEIVIPLLFPKINLSKISNILYKIMLVLGYILEPAIYTEKNQSGYKKFVEENRELILEVAKRHELSSVVAILESDGATQVDDADPGIDQMSIAAAKELFDFKSMGTGVKILWYKGNDRIVKIPRIIGRTEVSLVSSYAFPEDTVVCCSGKTFKRLSLPVQCNTYLAFLNETVKFSKEQELAMIAYFNKNRYAALEYAVKEEHLETIKCLLKNPLKPEEYDTLLEIANQARNAQITAMIMAEKEKNYSVTQREEHHTEKIEKELGIREKTLADYREYLSIYKNKVKKATDPMYSIVNLKKNLADIEVPAQIEGNLVDIYPNAFAYKKALETITFCEGLLVIGSGVARDCPKLRIVRIPGSVIEIGEGSFTRCNPTIHAPAGSYAETYAKENNIPFVAEE